MMLFSPYSSMNYLNALHQEGYEKVVCVYVCTVRYMCRHDVVKKVLAFSGEHVNSEEAGVSGGTSTESCQKRKRGKIRCQVSPDQIIEVSSSYVHHFKHLSIQCMYFVSALSKFASGRGEEEEKWHKVAILSDLNKVVLAG